jgi:hypothetical protein
LQWNFQQHRKRNHKERVRIGEGFFLALSRTVIFLWIVFTQAVGTMIVALLALAAAIVPRVQAECLKFTGERTRRAPGPIKQAG